MTTRKTARWKGSEFEYSCTDSLKSVFPDIQRLFGHGISSGYDLISHDNHLTFECKRTARTPSWNELIKWLEKLEIRSPDGYKSHLLFKPNHQPCMVMFSTPRIIMKFEDKFETKFIKHKGNPRLRQNGS